MAPPIDGFAKQLPSILAESAVEQTLFVDFYSELKYF
jgi:hypothetical protein